MINIGNLLDACGIYYTDKQLAKLEKLLKKLSLQQFDSNGTKQQHASTLDSDDKSRTEDFYSETKLKPMEKFDFKPDLNYENTMKEEILEESDIEIKEEPVNDPFASLETFNNSENVSDMVHEEDMESIDSSHHEHVKSVHDGLKPLRCNDYNGSKYEDLEFEMEIDSEASESSDDSKFLFSINKEFKCNSCDAAFSHNGNLYRHIKSVHSGVKSLKCNICDKSFSHNGYLKNHIESVHNQTKSFKCNICNKSFSLKGNLKKHTESYHGEKKSFQCNKCDKVFSQKGYLKVHIETIHEGKETSRKNPLKNPFKCNDCEAGFSKKENLKMHIKSIHSGVKSFKCTICDKKFSLNGNLKKHTASVHKQTKSFKCAICDKTFSLKGNLKKHTESVHEEKSHSNAMLLFPKSESINVY